MLFEIWIVLEFGVWKIGIVVVGLLLISECSV